MITLGCSGDGSDDDEEGEEEDASEAEGDFIQADEDIPDDPPMTHASIDQAQRDSGDDFITPYFPKALAVSSDRPLHFNFDLRLLDSLSLPCELVAREEAVLVPAAREQDTPTESVGFQNSAQAIAYCQERLRTGWLVKNKDDTRSRAAQRQLSHPELDKERLFRQEGSALHQLLSSGLEQFDSSLGDVRLDR